MQATKFFSSLQSLLSRTRSSGANDGIFILSQTSNVQKVINIVLTYFSSIELKLGAVYDEESM